VFHGDEILDRSIFVHKLAVLLLADSYSIRVGDNTKNFTFKMIFKMENICIMPGSYTVRISKKKVSEFLNKDGSIKYFISMEHDSTW
jgi:hypothetical protein